MHGYLHQRRRGAGPVTLLAGSDEMNGLDVAETQRTLERGQRAFTRAFGEPARGFLPPAWQRGQLRGRQGNAFGLEHVLGFFSLDPAAGRSVPLATWSWDCGRWGRLGHIGHGIGSLLHLLGGRIPSIAIHPGDVRRGFWPGILRLTEKLLDTGYEPTTPARLLETSC
jgi:hypothetical protein